MATTNVQMGKDPSQRLIAVYNAGTTDIPANQAVIIDASNILDNAGVKNQIAVTLPTDTTNPSVCLGITNVLIPAKTEGTVIPANSGQMAIGTCDGAVTAGTVVDNSVTSTKTGRIKTHTAGKYSLALALATGADGDEIPVLMSHAAPNA